MASLLGETLFEISGQGPAPTKDYFHFAITKSQVIWSWWKISLRSDCKNTPPGQLSQSHQDFLEDSRLQNQVAVVFGPHILQYSKNLCQGLYDYIVRLPNALLFNIMSHLDLEDISVVSRTCRRFRELCNSEEFWEQTVRRHCDSVTPTVEALAEEVGWRTVFFTNKLQLQMLISRRKQKENQPWFTISNVADNYMLLEIVKAFVHFGAFIVTGLFTCLIIATVWHNQGLHQNPL